MYVSYNKHTGIRYCFLRGTAIMELGNETLVYAFMAKKSNTPKSILWFLFASNDALKRGYVKRMKWFIKKAMMQSMTDFRTLRFSFHESNPNNCNYIIYLDDETENSK